MSAELRLKIQKRARKERRQLTEMIRILLEDALNNPP